MKNKVEVKKKKQTTHNKIALILRYENKFRLFKQIKKGKHTYTRIHIYKI